METSKKRILLINSHFGVGGIEAALINMANELCEQYDVDLLIYNPEGPMKERLDSRVNIIKSSFALKAMGMSLRESLRSKNLLIILFKLLASVWARVFDNRLPVWIASIFQHKLTGYDLAIAYRPETDKKTIGSGFIRILNRCVESKTKAAWIHFDAVSFDNDSKFNAKYYECADKIVGVSKSVMNAFESVNPDLADKMDYCYNFIDYEKLLKSSQAKQEITYPQDKFICFSACRLGPEKGIVRAITALAPVFKEHKDVLWYIAGDGRERNNIKSAIQKEGLDGRVILLGNQSNPYPYMKNSDLMLLTSYHEAAPVVFMEAKALHVPVFSTRTLSADEMLKDGVEDFICENSEEGIREKFLELMSNREPIELAKKNLAGYCGCNDKSFEKISELLEQAD